MKEDFLHFIWLYKYFDFRQLKSISGKEIIVHKSGLRNSNAGPDFLNALIEIDGLKWAGNVEIHINSSDWYAHNHQLDKSYDNIILHVVWNYDQPIYNATNELLETVELKSIVSKNVLDNYKKIQSAKYNFIPCENQLKDISSFVLNSWFEKLYVERLEQKSAQIMDLAKQYNYDWEAVLFLFLAKNFGLNVNGDSFFEMASNTSFSVVKKARNSVLTLESIFFGVSGLLDNIYEDVYFNSLLTEFNYAKTKFNLKTKNKVNAKFFRLRPSNFPTIRLSQLANLYVKEQHLFSKLIALKSLKSVYALFDIEVSDYWKTHYSFNSVSKFSNRKLTKQFIHLLVINTIVPFQFVYQKYIGKSSIEQQFKLMNEIKSEKNSVIEKFDLSGISSATALTSQALLQLYKNYCTHKKCMQCLIGNTILKP